MVRSEIRAALHGAHNRALAYIRFVRNARLGGTRAHQDNRACSMARNNIGSARRLLGMCVVHLDVHNFPTRFGTSPGKNGAAVRLWLDPSQMPPPLVFDGLRGANEVAYAAAALPHARFVALDAPDWERLKRLLGRNDDFDHFAVKNASVTSVDVEIPALDVHGVELSFSDAQMRTMHTWVEAGAVSLADLRAKLSIAVEERRNYDPGATLAVLREVAWQRTLHIDTVSHSPDESAEAIADWLCDQIGVW